MESHCLTRNQIVAFTELCASKLQRAFIEPGTAVGAIAATSIGLYHKLNNLKMYVFR
jgi:DNA-directed RNA polymerase III subunit RPC1